MVRELYDYIRQIPVIDTHEHLPAYENKRPDHDVIEEFLSSYYYVDLINAGLSKEELSLMKGNRLSIREKWKIIEKFWQVCRYTGYGQSLTLAARDIYGIEVICTETIERLNEAYSACLKEGHYRKVLKEKSNIKISILDTWGYEAVDPEYFVAANRIDRLILPKTGKDIEELEIVTKVTVCSFEDYLKACEIRIQQYCDVSPILKLGSAYSRSLSFPHALKSDAESGFNKMICSVDFGDKERSERTYHCEESFTNYMFRFILGLAQEKNMIMQVHTGLQDGNGNLLANSSPIHLNEIFLEYPNMKFDLFHIGYPYQNELGTLCKMFPNVYADMCWAHIVSPVAARRTLSEWLEVFPYNKISGFGGDYMFIDGVYGHQHIARKNIALVLSEKVEEGLLGMDDACKIGKSLLFDNPSEIFIL